MKKRAITLLAILIISLVLLPLATSQGGIIEGFEDKIEEVEEVKENLEDLTEEDKRSEYLKREWGELLEKTSAGKFFNSTDNVIGKIDPVFQTVLGSPFSWSWLFTLTLVMWALLLIWALNALTVIEPYLRPINKSKYIKWGIFIVFFVIISSVRVPKFISEFIISLIPKTGEILVQSILIIAIFFLLAVITIFFSRLKKYFLGVKKQEKRKITEKKVKKQGQEIEKLKEELTGKGSGLSKKEEREIEEAARQDIEGIGGEE